MEKVDAQASVIRGLIAEADYVLVTAGAGLSAAAGVDYTSRAVFQRFFPDMAERGFVCMYQFIGHKFDDQALRWGFLARQVDQVRFRNEMVTKGTYDLLRSILAGKDPTRVYCATTNVDGLLHRNGHFDFDTQVVELQGTYSVLQCMAKCRPDAFWPARPELDRLLAGLQPDGRTSAAGPTCPFCNGAAFLNVRGGDWFTEAPQQESRARFAAFQKRMLDDAAARVVILELGCGYNTPVVLRIPNERLAIQLGDRSTLVRVSMDHAHLHNDRVPNALLIEEDIHAFLEMCAK